jgi:hypothetical protein
MDEVNMIHCAHNAWSNGMLEYWHVGLKASMPYFYFLALSNWLLALRIGKELKRRLKASKPCLTTNSHELYDIFHFDALFAGSVHLKKPLVGPKGLIGPPCHGERRKNEC